jgi:RND family efflux transporter MFP subunit
MGVGRRLQILAGTIACSLLIGFVVVHHLRSADNAALARDTKTESSVPPPVVTIAAAPAPAIQPLTLPGETAAWFESTIYARVNGYVAKWSADIGDRVKKGQVLAVIDTPDLDAELAGARAKLAATEAQVKARAAETEFAKTTYARWRDAPSGVVSQQERDSKKADYDAAAARLNAAAAEVAEYRGDVDRLVALTQYKEVVAPFDGTIVERRIDIGNLVTAGSTTATTPLYRMSQDDPMRVFVDAPQKAAADMKDGLAAAITANDVPNRTFRGTVARTARAIDPRSRTLKVEVDLTNPDHALMPGLYVDVGFQLPARGAVEVPAGALIFRASGPQVAIVTQGDTVKFHDVTIARDEGNVVEIGAGLSPGDKIVLNISDRIADGDKVTVTESHQGLASAVPAPAP